jgi:hypothetical protein
MVKASLLFACRSWLAVMRRSTLDRVGSKDLDLGGYVNPGISPALREFWVCLPETGGLGEIPRELDEPLRCNALPRFLGGLILKTVYFTCFSKYIVSLHFPN